MSSPMPTPSTNEWSPEDLLAPLVLIATEGTYPPKQVTAHIAESAARVLEIAPARVYELVTPALCSKVPHLVLQWLRDAGLLVHVLPELDATYAFSQEADRRHKDVWEHTKAVVWQAVPRPAVRWAAALHDIGKVTTRRFGPAGKVTFHGHSEEGVRMFRRGVVKRIGFPPDEEKLVELLIRHHLRAGQYDGSWTDSAVRRFHREMEPFLRDLLDLSRADVTSRRPGKRKKALFMISGLAKRMRDLEEAAAKVHPLPPGLGNELMVALALPPGKHIGELRARLEALFDAGDVDGGREPAYYVDVVRERGLLDGLEIVAPRGWTPPSG